VIEGFRQIVVGAAIESVDPLLDAASRRDDQNGRGQARLAQHTNGVEAVAVRKPQIDDDEVVADRGRGVHQFGNRSDGVQPIAGAVQRVPQKLLEAHAILNEQESHCSPHEG
jgi:hypothetical protein